jgi:2-iminobutanoate/2-iminopropanoate deaminase
MNIHFSNPTTVAAPDGHFSQCALVSAATKLLFISGQVPRDVSGATVGVGDMTAQARCVFENLKLILNAHGAGFEHAVKATIFVTDIARAGEVTAVRAQFYGASKPASTFVEVSALGNPDWLLEVELIAAIP